MLFSVSIDVYISGSCPCNSTLKLYISSTKCSLKDTSKPRTKRACFCVFWTLESFLLWPRHVFNLSLRKITIMKSNNNKGILFASSKLLRASLSSSTWAIFKKCQSNTSSNVAAMFSWTVFAANQNTHDLRTWIVFCLQAVDIIR